MEVKCTKNPYYFTSRQLPQYNVSEPQSVSSARSRIYTGVDRDIYAIKRPNAVKSAFGLLSFDGRLRRIGDSIVGYCRSYKENIVHTYDHKVIYGLIAKELYGHQTFDSITHDADKMILYLLGFPKSFVSAFHRKHSSHHVESGKKLNLYSMLCDNIASSPEFKPEKKHSLRDYYNKSEELQNVKGFKELLLKYNFGEDLDFAKIKRMKNLRYDGVLGFCKVAMRSALLLLLHH